MRLLFVHDHRFVRGENGEMYSGGSLPSMTWARYLRHFDEVVVVGREGGKIALGAQLARADAERVRFELIPDMGSPLTLLRGSRKLDEVLDRELGQADALLASLPSQMPLRAVNKARSAGVPFAVEVMGCPWDAYHNHGHPLARAYAPIARARQRRVLKSAPLALYVTAKFLQERYPSDGHTNYASDVEVGPLGEAAHQSRQARLREIARGRLPRLGTVGSLRVKYKGLQIAIPAVAKLRREGLDLRYAILGPGDPEPYRALARNHGVEDLIEFAGVRPAGRGVAEWLDGIDIHVQPSFQEGLPRATVEAMARGAACMGSSCGGLPELLSPDRIHTPGDITTLAAQIAAMARNPQRIAAISRADLKTAEDYFPEPLQQRRDDIYGRLRELANERAKRRRVA